MSKRQAIGGHDVHGSLEYDDREEIRWEVAHNQTVDPRTQASPQVMSARKIAAPRSRRPGAAGGFRTGSPGGNVNSLGNIFGTPSQNATTNGINGATPFGSFGQNQQQPQQAQSQPPALSFGFGQNQTQAPGPVFGQSATSQNQAASIPPQSQSFPGPPSATPSTFSFGSAAPQQQQQSSFSFPSGSGGGFSFNAGTGSNPFAQQAQQAPQQNNVGGQTAFSGFGAQQQQSSGQTSPTKSVFGSSMFGKPATQDTPQKQQDQQSRDEAQPLASPTDQAMQISPPATPARGTGVDAQPQNSIFGTMSQGSKTPIFGSGFTPAAPKPSVNLFAPKSGQENDGTTDKERQEAPVFGGFGTSKNVTPKPADQQTQNRTSQTPSTSQAPGEQRQDEQRQQNEGPQTLMFGQSSQQQTPAKQAPDFSTPATKPSTQFGFGAQPTTSPAQPRTPATALPKQSFGSFQGQSASTPSQERGQQTTQTTGSGLGSTPAAKAPESSTPTSAQQSVPSAAMKSVVALNRSFQSAIQHMDVQQDASQMMKAYLAEIDRINHSYSAEGGAPTPAPNPTSVSNKPNFGAASSTSSAAKFNAQAIPSPPVAENSFSSSKRKADDSMPEGPPTKKNASSAQSEKQSEPRQPSPSKSQTSSLFSNIVSKPSAAAHGEQASGTDSQTEPPNPFATLKGFSAQTPARATFGSSSTDDAHLTTPHRSGAPSQRSNMFGNYDESQDQLDHTPTAPTPSPFTASTSAPSSSPSKPQPSTTPAGAPPAFNLFKSPSKSTSESPSKPPVSGSNTFGKSVASETPSKASANQGFVPNFGASKPSKTPSNASGPLAFVPSFGSSKPSETPAKASGSAGFKPTFGAAKPGDFFSQFGKSASATQAKEKAKRKAEEFDSDEDDEEEWERKDAERQAEKKRKLDEQGKLNVSFTGSGFTFSGKSSAAGTTVPAKAPDNFPNGSAAPAAGQIVVGDESNGDTEEDSSQSTPAPQPNTNAGKSLFDRITPADKPTENGEVTANVTKNPFASLGGPTNGADQSSFGSFASPSRDVFGQSSNGTPGPFSFFGNNTSPAGDHTWKNDSPIKFRDNAAPGFQFTPATPAKDTVNGTSNNDTSQTPKSNIFGSPAKPNPTPSLFSGSAKNGMSNGLSQTSQSSFGGLKGPSLLSSTRAADGNTPDTSRGTSPALSNVGTDGESVNGTGDEADNEAKDEQIGDLTGVPEGEEVVFEASGVKAMIHQLNEETKKKEWVTKGVGIMRVLKNQKTGLHSVFMRKVPNGHVVINTMLQKHLVYKDLDNGRVTMPVPSSDGKKIDTWFIRFTGKTAAPDAKKLVEVTNSAKEQPTE